MRQLRSRSLASSFGSSLYYLSFEVIDKFILLHIRNNPIKTPLPELSFYFHMSANCRFCPQQFYRNRIIMSHPKYKIQLPFAPTHTTRAHVFPKSQRFVLQAAQCPEAFYSNSSSLQPKTTNFGYGKKSDFTRTTIQSPPSNKYNILSPIGKTRGRSFGCSRQVSQKFSYINPELKFLPGPGQYETGLSPRNVVLGLSKTMQMDKKEPFPYTCGNYFVSKYRSTKYATIDPHAKRFPDIKPSPGPSDYHFEDSNKFESGYIVSSYRGAGSRHFDREARFTDSHWKVSETPGPGKYQA